MAGTALEGLDGVGLEDEEPFGAVPTPEEVRESLRSAPRPTTPVKYNLAEAEFWRLRHVPAGSVLLFKDPRSDPADDASVAALVLSTESLDRGVWVTVKVVGGSEEESKKRAQKFFRSGKRKLHLCNLDRDGMCMDVETEGLHLTQFEWFPPGDFSASWVSATGRKAIKDGKTMALEEEKKRRQEEERKEPPADGERPHTSRVEERLRSLARGPCEPAGAMCPFLDWGTRQTLEGTVPAAGLHRRLVRSDESLNHALWWPMPRWRTGSRRR